jgi:dTDP-glucose 4,6-dehydratase
MNYLLTGACGFIGSHTFDEFIKNNKNVVVLDKLTYSSNIDNIDRDKCNFYNIDICDKESVRKIIKKHNVSSIVNLAAETHVDNSISDPTIFVKSNVMGVLSLLEICKDHNILLTHISTDEVYGPANDFSFSEDAPLNPMNPYSATKASADHLIFSFHNTHNVRYKIIRPSNNFGPRQNSEKFIPKVLSNIKEKISIPVYGDGNQKRQWTYVKDTAKFIYDITVKLPENRIYNLGDNNILTNNDLLEKIFKITGRGKNLVNYVKDRPGHDKMYWINNNELSKQVEINFSNFESSLYETIKSSF